MSARAQRRLHVIEAKVLRFFTGHQSEAGQRVVAEGIRREMKTEKVWGQLVDMLEVVCLGQAADESHDAGTG